MAALQPSLNHGCPAHNHHFIKVSCWPVGASSLTSGGGEGVGVEHSQSTRKIEGQPNADFVIKVKTIYRVCSAA
jgi:hypothetical protein